MLWTKMQLSNFINASGMLIKEAAGTHYGVDVTNSSWGGFLSVTCTSGHQK